MTTTITSTAMTTSLIAKKLLLIAFGFGLLQELGVETLTGHQQLLNRSRELKSFRELGRVKDEADAVKFAVFRDSGRGGQVVSMLAFYCGNPNSNPADTNIFCCVKTA